MKGALLLLLSVVGFGTARAGFDWGSGCDAGSGEFSTDLKKRMSSLISAFFPLASGTRVRLTAASDVDVQLYDIKDKSKFKEGKALVAYCAEAGCNKGALGNNDGSKEETSYKGMLIQYSGYYGVDKQPGKEYITIVGELTTDLMMKAFAFEVGNAKNRIRVGKIANWVLYGNCALRGHIHVSRSKERRGGNWRNSQG